ncbi:GNAT family N-acetyltransferase [Herbiconiux sp. VKM Ac-2851]|uniref:GNAT family N-acetyltransferase n=1 Tax=Herbiconiux sp. VKM Ac-2851 TaxID=2739025 RepID=UPI0020B11CD8|nr:GNAT family N-acetyltransferase [Herbiconiux sp. VKM Ac-2851]
MELMELETARLTLRAPTIADVDHIARICHDDEISRFTTVPYPYRREDAADFVHGVIPAGWASGQALSWGIYPKPESHLAGVVSLSAISDGVAELGYWIDPHLRGRGLMTEAVARVVEYGLSKAPEGLGLRRIGW